MKQFLFLILFFSCLNVDAQIRVMTYNIRYDNAGDSANQWSNRKQRMSELLNKYSPDILGIQEGLVNQVNDLKQMLPGYTQVGVGRDDGKTKGEYSAIFFRTNKFELINSSTFWLSPTPDVVGSVGWDAALTRICTYAQLQLKQNGKKFFVFNTHFDHQGDEARNESAKLILQKINQLAGGLPVILMGDFNCEPNSNAYKTIVASKYPVLKDAYFSTTQNKSDTICTFTGFDIKGNICKRIDYIFTDANFKVISYNSMHDNDGKYFVSDHLPVMAIMNMLK